MWQRKKISALTFALLVQLKRSCARLLRYLKVENDGEDLKIADNGVVVNQPPTIRAEAGINLVRDVSEIGCVDRNRHGDR